MSRWVRNLFILLTIIFISLIVLPLIPQLYNMM